MNCISLKNRSISILTTCLVVTLFSRVPIAAQTYNYVFDLDIYAVQLRSASSLPLVDLRASGGALLLEFDHLGDDMRDYGYSLVHCNSDWEPSELDNNEYIDGFTEDRITDITNSFNTLMPYTHYKLGLPNRNMRWLVSGNYVLRVFDKDDDDKLVITRRFMVVERQWGITADFVPTTKVEKRNGWHEIDFSVIPKNMRISNPQNDVNVFVLQNGRWDNAIGPLKPVFTRGESLSFDFQDVVTFPAGKEYGYFDMRTFDYRGEGIKIITEKPTYYEVTLGTDESRADKTYTYLADLDGGFFIGNQNYNQTMLQCDYASVLFSLKQNLPLEDADVYVFGELTDWQLKPEFLMKYSHEASMYYCEAFLKQGYYNYAYVMYDHQTSQLDPEGFEGNWYETGNNYTILTYFRPFGARYDRLMGGLTLNSSRN